MLVRRLARPLFAAWFVVEGLDAARRPTAHVARAEAGWARARARFGAPPAPERDRLRMLVRAHGVAMVGAAALLALGRAPRTAALALAGLTLPIAVVNAPLERGGSRGGTPLDTDRFVRALSMLGGALLAGLDHEGRPGFAWRVQHARVDRAAAREARQAVASAAREAKAAARQVRRAAA